MYGGMRGFKNCTMRVNQFDYIAKMIIIKLFL